MAGCAFSASDTGFTWRLVLFAIFILITLRQRERERGVSLCVYVFVRVWECGWEWVSERERERERENYSIHLFSLENAVKGDNRICRATVVYKKLMCHFSHSWKKRVALEQAQKRLNLPVHGLITECQTRWGSRLLMIERILKQQKALHKVLSEDRITRHQILGH